MNKLTYSEILSHLNEDKPTLTPAHLKVIREALDATTLSETDKELESLKIIALANMEGSDLGEGR